MNGRLESVKRGILTGYANFNPKSYQSCHRTRKTHQGTPLKQASLSASSHSSTHPPLITICSTEMASSMVGNKGLALLLLAMLSAMGVASLASAGEEKGQYGGKGSYGGKGDYGDHGKGGSYMKDIGHGDHGKGGYDHDVGRGGYDGKGHGGHGPGCC
ncbi:hypothetical protein L7F22_032976 [Adiantum nelumboides]|nr:hypothetical protein [Adiantum nelumboides]